MRCWVKFRNERNPRHLVVNGLVEYFNGIVDVKLEEGGDDVKSLWPLCPGLHTCYNGEYKGLLSSDTELIL